MTTSLILPTHTIECLECTHTQIYNTHKHIYLTFLFQYYCTAVVLKKTSLNKLTFSLYKLLYMLVLKNVQIKRRKHTYKHSIQQSSDYHATVCTVLNCCCCCLFNFYFLFLFFVYPIAPRCVYFLRVIRVTHRCSLRMPTN